ncbi:MAG: hypothetical protein WBG92_19970 [Thiohalocapsa sp.]
MRHTEFRSADERRLARLYRGLDAQSRQTLVTFAEFLSERSAESKAAPEAPIEPVHEPRRPGETVVAAIQRLRRTYPMLDAGAMLDQASSLMAAHVLQGRAAEAVIDELEAVFAERFHKQRNNPA